MDIARLRVRIALQRNDTVTDRFGNHRSVWNDHYSCWATASDQTGEEKEGASHTEEGDRMDFIVRYCSETAEVTSKGSGSSGGAGCSSSRFPPEGASHM